jgi:cyclic pyranopterin phosphate synthase
MDRKARDPDIRGDPATGRHLSGAGSRQDPSDRRRTSFADGPGQARGRVIPDAGSEGSLPDYERVATEGEGAAARGRRSEARKRIDTLDPDKFRQITRRNDLAKIIEALFIARDCGLNPIKINAVIERGVNDGEIPELVGFARKHGFALRFIEYMDVGNANQWKSEKMVSKQEILNIINARYPLRAVSGDRGSSPSVDYEFVDGNGDIGVIASVTEPFCTGCTRMRLTADGKLVTCLFSEQGHDLKGMLRQGASDDALRQFISSIWQGRVDRYSDERLEAMKSAEGYKASTHKKIEMISLGG